MKVYFIGAGPGDPELITVKGQRLIEQSPVILFAGSLVPKEILAKHPADALVVDTSTLHFQQIVEYFEKARRQDMNVARVHSGDPSIYGAIGEQIRWLVKHEIEFEVVPGVTSTSASAAALGVELTLPGVSQTVILTRYEGKTAMPEGEQLFELARHKATMAIHLGITRIHKIVEELIPVYGADCPVTVLYRVSWPDEQRITGTLSDIVGKVRARKINRTALIIVGHVLGSVQFDQSYLYDESKAHFYRPRKIPNRSK